MPHQVPDVGPVNIEWVEAPAASAQMFADFVESACWLDIQRNMEMILRNIRDELETTRDMEYLGRLQSKADAIRMLMQLPYKLLEEIDPEGAMALQGE